MIKTRICDMISLHNLKTYHKKMKNGEIWGTLPKIWDKSKRWENLKAKCLKAFCDKYKKCHNEMKNSQIPASVNF